MAEAEQAAPRLAGGIWHGVDRDGDHVAVSPDGRLWWYRVGVGESESETGWAAYPESCKGLLSAADLFAWAMAERARADEAQAQVERLRAIIRERNGR